MKYQHALWTTEGVQGREPLRCATVGVGETTEALESDWIRLGLWVLHHHLRDLFRSIYSHAYWELQVGHN